MVNIDIVGDTVTFRVAGLHKLWALKSRVVVGARHIVAVEGAEAVPSGWAGWRLPGTWMPGVITAGSFWKRGGWTFWDVVHPANAIVVTLAGHWYSRLVVEVGNPEAARQMLAQAIQPARVS